MNITIRFIFKRRIDTPPQGSLPFGFTQLRLVDETFEVLDDNFSVNIDNENINDFSKAIDSKFTKTLKVAGTQKAIDFFKEYYEVRYEGENDFSFIFNSRTGEHCIIYVDDVEVMQGVALLTGITRNKNLTIFEIQVINDVKDILNEFKNLYIDELDEFNYEWTFENVRELLHTIKGDIFTGICMADGECVSQKFISSENAIRTAIDMSKIPIAANVKKIIDKGFEKIGVQYQSNFLNSDRLKALWLCNNKSENLGIWGDSDKILLDFYYDNVYFLDYLPFQRSELTYTDDNNENYRVYINKYDRNISKWDLEHGWSSFYGQSKYTSYEITINTSESDELDNYVNGATQHIYLVGGCKYRINFDLQNYAISGATNNKWRGHIIFKFTDLATNQVDKLNYYTDDFLNYNEPYSKNITFEKELEHNSILDIYVQEDIALHESYWDDNNEKMFVIDSNWQKILINITKIAGNNVRLQGSTINLYSQLPHISLYDVIVNLQKMFNLIFSLDKDTNKLVIEPEIDYYQLNSNTLLDITDLVDYDSEISIEPASGSIDYNKISAKYSISDKDYHNKYHKDQSGRDFGEFKTEFESYTKGELEIKNEFTICKAATYIYNDYFTFTASYENENGNLKKVSADKCFIGVRKVHADTHAKTIKLWYNENIHENYNSAQYNILDFCSNDFDYCYDTPRVVFSSMANLPIDNLFYTYYFKVLQEYIQLSGKIVRLKCYFDPITFSTLSKKRVVYWENNYWKLLKVSDWSPTKPVVDVVLLKMIDVEVPAIQPKPHIPDVQWFLGGFVRPAQVDVDNLSVTMLDTLSKVGALISNKAELVNISNVNDSAVAVQELSDILYSRYIQDEISKYDKVEHKIVECLLPDGLEIEFPDYSYFKGIYLFPVEFIEDFIFQNIIFTGNFKMDNLKIVSDYAFLNSVFTGDFDCPNLQTVGNVAFLHSQFNGAFNCPNLTTVGNSAFLSSNFTGEFNCPNLTTVGNSAFLYSQFNGVFNCPNLTTVGNYAFELSIFNGDFNCPNLLTVEKYAFRNSNFTGVFNCPNLQTVGDYAFEFSIFNGTFNCPNLQTVGELAFLYSQFTGVFNCPNLQAVGNDAFLHSQFNGAFNCPNLTTVGNSAFLYSQFNGDFNCPDLTSVGYNAFLKSVFDGAFDCPNLTTVGDFAFYLSQFNGEFNCPNLTSVDSFAFFYSVFTGDFDCPNLTTVGNYAFLNSNFTKITIGANATLGTGCIGAHSTEFIQDYADNGKLAGTYVWDEVQQHWIYQ